MPIESISPFFSEFKISIKIKIGLDSGHSQCGHLKYKRIANLLRVDTELSAIDEVRITTVHRKNSLKFLM